VHSFEKLYAEVHGREGARYRSTRNTDIDVLTGYRIALSGRLKVWQWELPFEIQGKCG